MKSNHFNEVSESEILVEGLSTIFEALQKIESNQFNIVFVMSKSKVIGTLTDGDIRRSILEGNFGSTCEEMCNKNFIFGLVGDSSEDLFSKFNDNIKYIPILHSDRTLVKIINQEESTFIPLASPNINQEETNLVLDCLNTNMISSIGKYVKQFENDFTSYIDSKHSIVVSNGTQALALALLASGISAGDEVIVPDLTFAATANAVIQIGAIPVLVDVEIETWNINVELIKLAITKKTKAIIPVHLYGLPCNMIEINFLAEENGLKVIEDAAEALGSEYQAGKKVGSLGNFAIFSFFANKIMSTGEGGMVTINNEVDIERIFKIRSHGMSTINKYWHDIWGTNMRITNLQAAVGVAQLRKLDSFLKKKIIIQKNYLDFFNDKLSEHVTYNRSEYAGSLNSHWLSCFKVDQSKVKNLSAYLAGNLVETRPFFHPLHVQPIFSKLKTVSFGDNWNSSEIHKTGICLPSGTTLTESNQSRICNLISDFFKK